MKNRLAFITFAFIVSLFFVQAVSAASCMISPSIDVPLLPDSDCDKVADPYDNCPFIANPNQQDADRNGLGNACDMVIESVRTNPADFVFTGRAFNVIATLHNNRDYNIINMKVRVTVPELGIESVQYIDNLDVCESRTLEFMLRAPICSDKLDHEIVVQASFDNIYGEEERIPAFTSIRVVPDQFCQDQLAGTGPLGNTYVQVMEIQDVYKGQEAVFPIKISNREGVSQDYVISMTGFDGWGSGRVSPGSIIIVPANADRTVDIYVSAIPEALPGEHVFVVTIQRGEELQRFLLIAYVKENPELASGFLFAFGARIVFITVLVLLLIIAAALAVWKLSSSAKREASQTYY